MMTEGMLSDYYFPTDKARQPTCYQLNRRHTVSMNFQIFLYQSALSKQAVLEINSVSQLKNKRQKAFFRNVVLILKLFAIDLMTLRLQFFEYVEDISLYGLFISSMKFG